MNPPTTSSKHGRISFTPHNRLLYWLLLLMLSWGATQGVQAQEIDGDSLQITGDDGSSAINGGLSVAGGLFTDTLYFGPGDETSSGAYLSSNYASGTDYVNFFGDPVLEETYWTWANGYWPFDDSEFQMTLDPTGVLTLYNGTNTVTFDPGNQTINFSSGLMTLYSGTNTIAFDPGNQTITFASGVILSGNTGNLTIFVGNNGFAPGNGASASGAYSAALGGGANAEGSASVALANSNAYGTEAVSMSEGTANGNDALAISQGTADGTWSVAMIGGTANATDSLAIGSGAYANATAAMALGNGTAALAWSSLTVGHYNADLTANSTTAWAATDPAFIVGTGNSTTPANGLVVLNNGIIYAAGNTTNVDPTYGLPQNTTVARLAWIPQLSSFIAGSPGANSTWNYGNLGVGTVAIGYNLTSDGSNGTVVMGYGSSVAGSGAVALGLNASVQAVLGSSGNGSVAIGNGASVKGLNSVAIAGTVDLTNAYIPSNGVAIGGAYVNGFDSFAVGSWAGVYSDAGMAIGYTSFAGGDPWNGTLGSAWGASAFGASDEAIGQGAVAHGFADWANGYGAVGVGSGDISDGNGTVALGGSNAASADNAVAIGGNNTVTGIGSAAIGSNLTVSTDHALVAGQWAGYGNATISGSGPTSVLFALGNGTGNTTLSNAFVVLKNGNTTINGNLTVNGTITGNIELGGSSIATGSNAIALDGGNASGNNTMAWDGGNASGNNALAFGLSTNSTGNGSIAFGNSSVASGVNGIALDGGNASGSNALAWSGGVAGGNYSLALGVATNATGNYSFALGNSSVAEGSNAIALGGGNATGNNSLSFGLSSNAAADGSITLGANLTSNAFNSVIVGHYSNNTIMTGNMTGNGSAYVLTGNTTAWQDTDPAFIVGIGNSSSPTDGLVIQNNGNVTIPKRQGDIIMGNFGNGGGD